MLQLSSGVIAVSVDHCLFIFSCTEPEVASKEKPFWGCEISEEASEISQATLGQVSISRDMDLLSATSGNHSKGRSSSKSRTSASPPRLASEGVYSIIRQGQVPGVRVQAWGSVSLPDVLLLVDVKYDVVTRLLYQEMLQEHHSKTRGIIRIYRRSQPHDQSLFWWGTQLPASGRACCRGNSRRRRRTWRVWQRMLWSRATPPVWLSCLEHSGYTGNTPVYL